MDTSISSPIMMNMKYFTLNEDDPPLNSLLTANKYNIDTKIRRAAVPIVRDHVTSHVMIM